MSRKVVAGEIVRIHSYLLAAPRLRYMTGGSSLIETFSRRVVPGVAEAIEPAQEMCRCAGAGRFTLEFAATTNANSFRDAILQIGNSLFGMGVLLVSRPVDSLGEALDNIRKMKISVAGIGLGNMADSACQYMQRCSACGRLGASKPSIHDKKYKKGVNDKGCAWLCEICGIKLMVRDRIDIKVRLHGVNHLKGIVITDDTDNARGRYNDLLPVQYEDSYVGNGSKLTDFQKIAEKGSPSGFLGVFYADGNSMGELVSRCRTTEEYRKFSDGITESIDIALKAAMSKSLDVSGRFNGEVLIKGGDDLLVVLPADKAILFAEIFLSKASEDDTAIKNGICGGLVLAKPALPFKMLFEKAEELLKSAKIQVWRLRDDKGKERTPSMNSAVDFIFLTSSLLLPIEKERARLAYPMPNGRGHTLFTARPYLIKEFRELIKKISEFKGLHLPRHIFFSLKDIFCPFLPTVENRREGPTIDSRIDKDGNFVELKRLIERQKELHVAFKGEIESFFNDKFIGGMPEWKAIKDVKGGSRVDAKRVWEADIVDLCEFL